MLLNEKGQAKMCDMGIAKVVIGSTYTVCGTPEYMAPEKLDRDNFRSLCKCMIW